MREHHVVNVFRCKGEAFVALTHIRQPLKGPTIKEHLGSVIGLKQMLTTRNAPRATVVCNCHLLNGYRSTVAGSQMVVILPAAYFRKGKGVFLTRGQSATGVKVWEDLMRWVNV